MALSGNPPVALSGNPPVALSGNPRVTPPHSFPNPSGPAQPLRPLPNPLARSQRAAALAAVVAAIFAAVLIVWGLSLGSLAMTVGGIFTAGRAVMGVLILVGIQFSRRRSATFPDGLYKLDNIVAVLVGVIILVLTYEAARLSMSQLARDYSFTDNPRFALPVFVFAGALAVVMGFYKRRVAAQENCPSLKADATFSFADAAALMVIGVALGFDMAGLHRADAVAGLIVAGMLAVVGVRILVGGLRVLLDVTVDAATLQRAREVALFTPGIRRVLAVAGRSSGSFIFLHLTVQPAAFDVARAADVGRALQENLKRALPRIDRVIIEFGAPNSTITAAVPVAADGESVVVGFSSAPLIAFLEATENSVETEESVETKESEETEGPLGNEGSLGAANDPVEMVVNPALDIPAGQSIFLAVFLGRRAIDVLLVRAPIDDEDVAATLRAYGVSVAVHPDLATVAEARAVVGHRAVSRVIDPQTTSPPAGSADMRETTGMP